MTKIEILNKYKKQKHNTYRECDVINAMEKYLESYKQSQALQLQQTGVSCSANYHAKEIVKKLISRPHLEDVDGFYDIYNDELQMIDIVEKYLSKHYR